MKNSYYFYHNYSKKNSISMKKNLLTLVFFTIFSCLAVAQSLPSINWQPRSDWINVKDFGAKGDGKTDDSAALQKAFDKLGSNVTIYLPAGKYIISKMLQWKSEKRLLGVSVIGHGRDTTLIWQGAKDGKMIRDAGLTLSRFVGFELDGQNSAAIGIWHDNNKHFETNIRNRFLALRNFRDTGMRMEENKNDGASTAEITFENCIFENCGKGISFTSFNDYNYTFEGCSFKKNKFGIYCVFGNFYVRDSRFESNGVDIFTNPEHMCSVRRSISIGSGTFLDFNNSVSPMTVENCYIADWKSAAAIRSGGAPLTMFDCVFKGQGTPVNITRGDQQVIISENKVIGGGKLFKKTPVNLHRIPAGKRQGIALNENISLLKNEYKTPTKIFDAKEDFGAIGNGRVDDTKAIQRTIDAASAHGNGAMAYLPRGDYNITDTLKISGKNFYFGGCGIGTKIQYVGPQNKNAVEVRNPDHIVLENFSFLNNKSKKKTYQADIMQFGSDKPSFITYYGVYAFGKYKKIPDVRGIRFKDLTENDRVHLNFVEGNLRITNSNDAEILSNCSFEGTLIIEGEKNNPQKGIIGFMTRLTTWSKPCVIAKDNASFVVSDFYMEQCPEENLVLTGSSKLPSGRITLGLGKLQKTTSNKTDVAINFKGYNGTLGIVSGQFYSQKVPMRFIASNDTKAQINILGSCFYRYEFDYMKNRGLTLNLVGNRFAGKATSDGAENLKAPDRCISNKNDMSVLLDDFRKLGHLDFKFNYPGVMDK